MTKKNKWSFSSF